MCILRSFWCIYHLSICLGSRDIGILGVFYLCKKYNLKNGPGARVFSSHLKYFCISGLQKMNVEQDFSNIFEKGPALLQRPGGHCPIHVCPFDPSSVQHLPTLVKNSFKKSRGKLWCVAFMTFK